MAKTTKRREWTKDDVRTLKTLARDSVKTTVIARKLKRSVGATYQQASKLGVSFGGGRGKKRKASAKPSKPSKPSKAATLASAAALNASGDARKT
jgi:hypothetical protein